MYLKYKFWTIVTLPCQFASVEPIIMHECHYYIPVILCYNYIMSFLVTMVLPTSKMTETETIPTNNVVTNTNPEMTMEKNNAKRMLQHDLGDVHGDVHASI